MIELICGAKGSGKTKRMIDMANANIENASGSIVFLSDTDRYMYDIRYQIRFVNTEKHGIFTEEALLGFIKGILASDHDIESFYIDGAHRILKKDVSEMKSFYDALLAIARNSQTKFYVAVSKDVEEMPDFLAEYIKG
jgi:thymidine kinase